MKPGLPANSTYLCQVNEHLSCGACCGLYNIKNLTRENLHRLLLQRTQLFERVPRDPDSIMAFKGELETVESRNSPDPGLHHCPFVGLIGEKRSRIGCLLHPLSPANKNVDFRGLSFWGGLACNCYFCPSHRELPTRYKIILKNALDDWYLYGLVATEKAMLQEFLEAVESAAGRTVTDSHDQQNPGFLKAVKSFLEMKCKWPYRAHPDIEISNFTFGPPPGKSETDLLLGMLEKNDPFPETLIALNTVVASRQELEDALELIGSMVSKAAQAL